MAKTVRLVPINQDTSIKTNDNLLSGLLSNEIKILPQCGGRGRCATCHIYIKSGMESLSPLNRQEQRTLETITTCGLNSRLACQARVIGEGIVVELPSGTYVSEIEDIEGLIGGRAEQDILHPLSGKVLVEQGKFITRSMISQLRDTQEKVDRHLQGS